MFFQVNSNFVYFRMEFVRSNKGKRKLALNGFLYVCNRNKNGGVKTSVNVQAVYQQLKTTDL